MVRIIYLVFVFKWYKQFSEGQESTEDDQRSGQLVSTSQTVTKINEIVCEGHRMSIWMNAETVNANKEIFGKMLLDEFEHE